MEALKPFLPAEGFFQLVHCIVEVLEGLMEEHIRPRYEGPAIEVKADDLL